MVCQIKIKWLSEYQVSKFIFIVLESFILLKEFSKKIFITIINEQLERVRRVLLKDHRIIYDGRFINNA